MKKERIGKETIGLVIIALLIAAFCASRVFADNGKVVEITGEWITVDSSDWIAVDTGYITWPDSTWIVLDTGWWDNADSLRVPDEDSVWVGDNPWKMNRADSLFAFNGGWAQYEPGEIDSTFRFPEMPLPPVATGPAMMCPLCGGHCLPTCQGTMKHRWYYIGGDSVVSTYMSWECICDSTLDTFYFSTMAHDRPRWRILEEDK